jgi:hypothetical protein
LAPFGWREFSLLKMDIEGCEYEALLGAEKVIARYRPVLWLEINHPALVRRGFSGYSIAQWLVRNRYSWHWTDEKTAGWESTQSNLLCLPR